MFLSRLFLVVLFTLVWVRVGAEDAADGVSFVSQSPSTITVVGTGEDPTPFAEGQSGTFTAPVEASKTPALEDAANATRPTSPQDRPMYEMLKRRWPNNTIPILFPDNYPDNLYRPVYSALNIINKLTCLKMVNATEPSQYHAKIVCGKRACFSRVGFANDKSRYQTVNLHPVCFGSKLGTIVHEFIHTIGFHHQQVRADRDKYITIHEDRIIKDKLSNFRKARGKYAFLMTQGLPYEYNSVMQYPLSAFNKEGGFSMSMKTNFPGLVGQRNGPSRGDIAAINRFYECWDHYLGNDIPGAIPYKEFHAAYIAETPKFSKRVRDWADEMLKLTTKS